mmetsp:Transcript_13665/g.20581  ORF Transcript_13665/g.20581 Transcript_13665/m.20581 type:complete len:109 (-) Transcript_13665:170-496(-)
MTDNINSEEYVTLSFKLMDWSHMDFKRKLPTSTSIITIKDIIKHHHGSISSIVICKHSFEEKNELHNANATLKFYGIRGSPDIGNAPCVVLYYNFKAVESQIDPILMC